jgi:hypothetical protein
MAGAKRVIAVGAAAAAMILMSATPASADPATPTNYRSQVIFVEGRGVAEVEIIGGDAFVRLTADPGVTVEVLGYEGEQYIRFEPDGTVQVNLRSPSKYLNDDRYADVELPPEADAAADPRWESVSTDGVYSWHDHRTHWMSPTPPAAVGESGGAQTVQIFDWTLPLRIDGEVGEIAGTLTWIPSTTALPWFALSFVTLITIAAGSTRVGARRQAIILLALAVAALGAGLASMAVQPPEGRTYGIDLLGPPVIIALGILAIVQTRQSDRSATQVVLIGGVGLAIWGLLRLDVLTHPILPTILPYALDRLITAAVLGGAIGLVAGITVSMTLANRVRRLNGDPHHTT